MVGALAALGGFSAAQLPARRKIIAIGAVAAIAAAVAGLLFLDSV